MGAIAHSNVKLPRSYQYSFANRYDLRYRADEVTYVLARCQPGVAPADLRDAIAAEIQSGQMLTTAEFTLKTIKYRMLETGLGITVILTAILGHVLRTVIISQILYAITNDHPNETVLPKPMLPSQISSMFRA